MKILKPAFGLATAFIASLLTLSVLTLAVPAQARSIDPTKVIAAVSGDLENIEAVYLLADGRLQLKMQDGTIQTSRVSKVARERMVQQTQVLSNAKVTETMSPVVCMMVPPPNLANLQVSGYDFTTGEFDSKLRLILTDDNCSISHKVLPQDKWAMERALELRAELRILAINLVK